MQTARAGGALVLANARYWTTVAPLVRTQLSQWQRRARAIPEPLLQALATGKLREERFNVETAATLATLAPRARRRRAAEAIVALQVAYDYLDALTEPPAGAQLLADPLEGGRRLHRALIDAVTPAGAPQDRPRGGAGGDYCRDLPHAGDGGYLQELVDTARRAFAQLPSATAVATVARASAERCAQAQARAHASTGSGGRELESWARGQAAGGTLGWPEWLAGAQASVLAQHALIAAAAEEHTTRVQAERIDAVYLSIGALTMLDSLIDRERDLAAGEVGYTRYYASREQMAEHLARVARAAASDARALPHAGHHVMTLTGVVAYYASAPAATGAYARPVTERLRRELEPLIMPMLALMRGWRMAKSLRRRLAGEQAV